jgi:hypothetical protein
MSKPSLKVTADFTEDFNKVIAKFKRDVVLVGIPSSDTEREDDDPIGNAALLAINNFGSEANGIPARPVMQNGIKNAQEEIAAQFKKATIEALTKGVAILSPLYNRVGIIASNSIKKAINAQDFEGGGPDNEGPSEATLKARKAKGFKGTKSLIVTGQMRNAITYVVKGED